MRFPAWFSRAIYAGLAVCFVSWAAAELRQSLLRHRAQELLNDIRALQVNRSDWKDAQRLRDRWGKWHEPIDDSCTEEDCFYIVSLDDRLFDSPEFVYQEGWHLPLRFFDHLGLRSSQVRASFRVIDGIVIEKGFNLMVARPVEEWISPKGVYDGILSAGFSEAAHLDTPGAYDEDLKRNPNSQVTMRRGFLGATFTPEEVLSEQAALTDIRLNCITQWTFCSSLAQILPRAEQRYEALDMNAQPENPCPISPRVLAREVPDIWIVDDPKTLSGNAGHENGDDLTSVHVTKTLKGTSSSQERISLQLFTEAQSKAVLSGSRQAVILGMSQKWTNGRAVFLVARCGVLEANPDNYALIMQGVRDDFDPRH